jgi:hypothetical protein
MTSAPAIEFEDARLAPNGAWVIAKAHALSSDTESFYRVPIGGGAPQLIFAAQGERCGDFRCTNQRADFCVYEVRAPNRQALILKSFDPMLENRTELLRIPIDPGADYHWALSPDGSQVGVLKSEWGSHRIRFFELRNGTNPSLTMPALRFMMILPIFISGQALAQVASQEYGATRVEFCVRGRSGFVIKPNHSETRSSRPWLWYAPTFVRATPQTGEYPNQSLTWSFTRLLEHGVWIAGVDVGESWGNSQGRKACTKFYEYVCKQFALSSQPCLLGQSRGGMMLFDWAPEHPDDVRCIAGIYPVTNLTGWPDLGGREDPARLWYERDRIAKAPY